MGADFITANAGCDKCGTYDRADGSKFCLPCGNEETDCSFCAYDGDTVTSHNPVAHAENGDMDKEDY